MKFRLIGAVVFGVVGWLLGTGITGGIFDTISGVGVLIVLGFLLGLSAGPDLKYLYNQFKK
ncbi:MAG: hypothetical protein HRT36_04865 [Alphaproteobacteria bacterium]|nr:hypothetical protein [Alphaproteobacteria bacterium]